MRNRNNEDPTLTSHYMKNKLLNQVYVFVSSALVQPLIKLTEAAQKLYFCSNIQRDIKPKKGFKPGYQGLPGANLHLSISLLSLSQPITATPD